MYTLATWDSKIAGKKLFKCGCVAVWIVTSTETIKLKGVGKIEMAHVHVHQPIHKWLSPEYHEQLIFFREFSGICLSDLPEAQMLMARCNNKLPVLLYFLEPLYPP